MDEKKPESFAKLNDELLAPKVEDQGDKKPGRNSKEDLIAKIVACCADNDIPLPHSDLWIIFRAPKAITPSLAPRLAPT